MNPVTQLKQIFLVAVLPACFVIPQSTNAVFPPPDGGYPNFTTAEGTNALRNLSTGAANTAVGWFSLFSDTEGSFNTATGAGALLFNTADQNTAFGTAALLFNSTGNRNTAVGAAALLNNTEGNGNTAVGDGALHNNSTADTNTAIGHFALFSNTTGLGNTATGDSALFNNEGDNNTANGSFALGGNTTGEGNTATGWGALFSNTTGGANTAVGNSALFNTTTGGFNTAIGAGALVSNTGGSSNIALGVSAGLDVTTASGVICIGASGENVDNSCFIGRVYSNVQPIVGTNPDSVTITSSGRLGRGNVSSRRYKHNIRPMDKASEVLYALKPVNFRYHKEYDATQTLAFGLIAEEVAEVYPDLVGRNPKGEPESVRYEQINAMLLNEFLKEHKTMQELKSNAAQQEVTIARQQKQIDALTTGLQKVSAQLEASKPAPQVVKNDY